MFSNKKSTGILLKLVCIVLALTFVMAGVAVAEETPITVLIDGEKVEFDAQPKMVNDRVMVPLRAILKDLKQRFCGIRFLKEFLLTTTKMMKS